MRALRFFASALAFLGLSLGLAPAAEAQLGATRAGVTAIKYDANAQAWFGAVGSAGGSVSFARRSLVNTLIVGLKADGVWTKLDSLLLLAAENSQSALVDLIALRTATAVNSPTFTADRGYTGNGSSSYVDTNFNLSTNATGYALNSAHMMVYVRTARSVSSAMINAGAKDGGGHYAQVFSFYDGSGADMNDDGTGTYTTSPANGAALWLGSRTASNAVAIYRNGSAFYSRSTASAGVPAYSVFIGGRNDSGSFAFGATDQHAAFSAGAALNSTEAANLSSRINAYMTALGANTY